MSFPQSILPCQEGIHGAGDQGGELSPEGPAWPQGFPQNLPAALEAVCCQTREILDAIKEIYEGGAPMSPIIASKVLRMFKFNLANERDDLFNLSSREKEILKCLVEGMSYKMIADTCFISADTVNGHIKNIYKKLQVHSKGEAVAKAIKGRIV